jgi:hypothetical protein
MNRFRIVRTRSQSTGNVSLLFTNRIEHQTRDAQSRIELANIDQRPLALAAAVSTSDHHCGHRPGRVFRPVKNASHTRSGLARPDPFLHNHPISVVMTAGLRC